MIKRFLIKAAELCFLVFMLLNTSCAKQPYVEWKGLSREQYSVTPNTKWLPVPLLSENIDIGLFAGRDVNYRFLRFQIPGDFSSRAFLMEMLKINPHSPTGNVIEIKDIPFSEDHFRTLFPSAWNVCPKWWSQSAKNSMSSGILITWDDGNYGYGYWWLENGVSNVFQCFQWSEQHFLTNVFLGRARTRGITKGF